MEAQLYRTHAALTSNSFICGTSSNCDILLQRLRGTRSHMVIPFLFGVRRQALLELDGALQDAQLRHILRQSLHP